MQPKKQSPKPRRQAHRPKSVRPAETVIVEAVYAPDIERQIACLRIVLGLPYTRPTGKAA